MIEAYSHFLKVGRLLIFENVALQKQAKVGKKSIREVTLKSNF